MWVSFVRVSDFSEMPLFLPLLPLVELPGSDAIVMQPVFHSRRSPELPLITVLLNVEGSFDLRGDQFWLTLLWDPST